MASKMGNMMMILVELRVWDIWKEMRI